MMYFDTGGKFNTESLSRLKCQLLCILQGSKYLKFTKEVQHLQKWTLKCTLHIQIPLE